jgi:hypothetical protein
MILRTVLVLMIPLMLFGAEEKKAAAKPPAKNQRLTLPADAKEVEPNTYRYTDPKGTKWIYRQTPFGLTRYEDKEPVEKKAEKPQSEPVKATEDGDSIRFERHTPFGVQRWVRKKAELNAEEQRIWDQVNGKKKGVKETPQE